MEHIQELVLITILLADDVVLLEESREELNGDWRHRDKP